MGARESRRLTRHRRGSDGLSGGDRMVREQGRPGPDGAGSTTMPGERHQAPRPELQLEDLVRWEENGAGWRVLEMTDGRAVLELCSCVGEPVDVLVGRDPRLLAHVRARGSSG